MKTAQMIAQNSDKNSLDSAKDKKKRKIHANSLKNLVAPFQPGQSGNPKGRPKDIAGQLSRAAFENNKKAIYEAIAAELLSGSPYAYSVHSDRGYGKLKQGFIHTGDEEGGPIKANITVEFVRPNA